MIALHMITVDEAQQRLLREVSVFEPERIALDESLGRVLREDIRAPVDVPQLDNSAMDGYAVRAAETPARLCVVGEIPAGRIWKQSLEGGTVLRIMTGAPIPDGADAVAQVEITDGGTDFVVVQRAVEPGANIRRRGEDMRAGDIVLRSGMNIGPAEIGVLATVQKSSVLVGRRPTVAILATGNELIGIDEPPVPGKSVNSNSWALAAMVRQAGAVPRLFGTVPDECDATVRAIESALDCDFIVSSGGVSVGAYDFVKDALEVLGAETQFWRVAMKPGKPIVLSRLRDRLYFGLPGNPVSSMVSFALFVGPAIRKAMGQSSDLFPPTVNVRTTTALKGAGDRRTYLRVRVVTREGTLLAEPMRGQGSAVSTSMVQANGLAVLDIGTKHVAAGESVPVLLLGPIFS